MRSGTPLHNECVNARRDDMDNLIAPGDLVFIWAPPKGDSFIVRIVPGGRQDSRLGQILHDNMIGKSYGGWISTNLGKSSACSDPMFRNSAGG